LDLAKVSSKPLVLVMHTKYMSMDQHMPLALLVFELVDLDLAKVSSKSPVSMMHTKYMSMGQHMLPTDLDMRIQH
jgi:hypothetical protein